MSEVEEVLKERGSKYNISGTYEDHSDLTQIMKSACRGHRGWVKLNPGHMEAIDMILHKIARIINGDPYYDDNWRDIGGYAKLAQDIKKT